MDGQYIETSESFILIVDSSLPKVLFQLNQLYYPHLNHIYPQHLKKSHRIPFQ